MIWIVDNGEIVAWGDWDDGQTDVPVGMRFAIPRHIQKMS